MFATHMRKTGSKTSASAWRFRGGMTLVCAEAVAWAVDIEVDVLEVFEALLLEMLET